MYVVLTGIGLAIRRSFGLREGGLDDLLIAFWMGFAALLLFLILWNFAFPVNGIAAVVVGMAGAAGLATSIPALRGAVAEVRRDVPPWAIVATVLMTLWLALSRSTNGPGRWTNS